MDNWRDSSFPRQPFVAALLESIAWDLCNNAPVQLSTCPNCGAQLAGGNWTCRYCRASIDPAHVGIPSLAEFAVLSQGGAQALTAALPKLAAALEAALPGAVEIERGKGVWGGRQQIKAIWAEVGDYRFGLRVQSGRAATTVEHVVRGIALRHDTQPPGEWLQLLGERLREQAAQSRTIEPALKRLLGTDQ